MVSIVQVLSLFLTRAYFATALNGDALSTRSTGRRHEFTFCPFLLTTIVISWNWH
jgi:hypothetical protein